MWNPYKIFMKSLLKNIIIQKQSKIEKYKANNTKQRQQIYKLRNKQKQKHSHTHRHTVDTQPQPLATNK